MTSKLKLYLCLVVAGLILTACSNGLTRFYNNSPFRLTYTTNTSRVSGVVLDQSGRPVANAQIRVRSAYQSVKAQTDLNGRFSLLLTIPGDSLSLTIKAANYATLDCKALSRYMLINDDWQFRLTDESSKPPVADSARCIIRGIITDSSGEPIPGASIRLAGTKIGAAASINGQFLIKDIPPGNYEIISSSVGYCLKRINIMNIAADSSAALFITLKMQSININAWDIYDGPPEFSKYNTSNCWEIKSEKLSRRPAKNINQALRACPGISR
jgi:hypothetical protein